MKHTQHQYGFSLIEIVIAIALFSMFVVAIVGLAGNYFSAHDRGNEYTIGAAIAADVAEDVRSMRNRGWNTLTAPGAVQDGDYLKETFIEPACRDANQHIVPCDEGKEDIETKRIRIRVSWPGYGGGIRAFEQDMLLTNWDAADWIQQDWSHGPGQRIWQDPSAYESDDGGVGVNDVGELTLRDGGACRIKTWEFTDPDEYIYDPEKIRIEDGVASLVPLGTEIRGFRNPPVERYEFEPATGLEPKMIHVSEDVYAMVYRGPQNKGTIRTIEIQENGNIETPFLKTAVFDATYAKDPDIVHITGSVYAMVYQGPGRNNTIGTLRTLHIQPNGQIGGIIDTFQFETSRGLRPQILQVGENTYAIAYVGPGNDGFVRTVYISDAGLVDRTVFPLGKGIVDQIEFDPVLAQTPEIMRVTPGIYALMYRGNNGAGLVRTIAIGPEGDIGNGVIDTFTFEAAAGYEPQGLQIADDVFVIVYRGPGNDGYIQTIRINAQGLIADERIARFRYDATLGYHPQILRLRDDVYAIAIRGSANDGYVKALRIANDGTLPNAVIASMAFAPNDTISWPQFILLDQDTLVFSYQDAASDGQVVTVNLDEVVTYPNNRPWIQPKTSLQVRDIDQWAVATALSTTTQGSTIRYQLSDDRGETWDFWNGNDWVLAGAQDANTMTEIRGALYRFNTSTASLSIRAFLESNGQTQAELGRLQIGCTNLQYEVGQLVTDEAWQRVDLKNKYVAPVIVATAGKFQNNLPISVRIRNITSSTFEARLQEPTEKNIAQDQITYLVLEEGVWNIEGVWFEAKTHFTSTVGRRGRWIGDTVSFSRTFAAPPIVLHQVMSYADPKWISTFVSAVGNRTLLPDTKKMQLGLNGGKTVFQHGAETIGWIALDSSVTTTIGGVPFESTRTPSVIRGPACTLRPHAQSFAVTPLVIASQQKMKGDDGSWTLMCKQTPQQTGFTSQEVLGNPPEEQHPDEVVGYLAFEKPVRFTRVIPGFEVAERGVVTSSAFALPSSGAIQLISWEETIPVCNPACRIRIQVQAAPDLNGRPGSWTPWYGAAGPGTFFTTSTGSIIPQQLNGYAWMRYRVDVVGDGLDTPTLESIRLNYKAYE